MPGLMLILDDAERSDLAERMSKKIWRLDSIVEPIPIEIDARIVAGLLRQVDRLTERCAAYKGQVEAGSHKIEQLRTAEKMIRDAYVRLRALIPGAMETAFAPTPQQVYETTETALRRVIHR